MCVSPERHASGVWSTDKELLMNYADEQAEDVD